MTFKSNKGQATALEGILIIILIGVLAFVFWQQLTKKTQSNTFRDRSQQHQTTTTINHYSLLSLLPFSWEGCALHRQPNNEYDNAPILKNNLKMENEYADDENSD